MIIPDQKPPLISLDELKLLVHKESGYRIQISDDDPLLTTIYVNLAVLGSALNEAGALQKSAAELIDRLPGAADKELKRAGDAAIEALSHQVGAIAQKIAGDAAAEKNHTTFIKMVSIAAMGVIICAVVFGGGGFLAAKSIASIRVNAAESALTQANFLLQNEKKRIDEKIADLEKESVDKIAKIRAASGWAGTPEGQLAKKFFDLGNSVTAAGVTAARCSGSTWDIRTNPDGTKWCIPKRRDLIGGNDELYGWKIP